MEAGTPAGNPNAGHQLDRIAAPNLGVPGARHGFFMRNGGVSGGIYASLNCGRGSRDNRSDVEENRSRVAAALDVQPAALIGPRQAHTNRVVFASAPCTHENAPEADGVVTNVPGLAIGILSADCAPLLFMDAEAGVIAAVHAGWKGAKAGIVDEAVRVMEQAGAKRERIAVAIGPTISQKSYEVGPEFQAAFTADDAGNALYFARSPEEGRPHFDLPRFLIDRLRRSGIENSHNVAVCTYENEQLVFSHRRAVHRGETDYGRQISAIVLA